MRIQETYGMIQQLLLIAERVKVVPKIVNETSLEKLQRLKSELIELQEDVNLIVEKVYYLI